MAKSDEIPCELEKFYEGDVDSLSSISECLTRKIGKNINALEEMWKLTCKEFLNGETFTTGDFVGLGIAISSQVIGGFNLNTVGGEVVSFAGENGFTLLENLTPNTSYPITTSGKITIICMECNT